MSNNKPLSYEGSKTILQYLEANLRFQLSSRCPSLRKTEQLIPLYIDQLVFRKDKFLKMSVNSDEYYVGVYRKYPPGVQIPKWIQEDNESGGDPSDLDQFGYVDKSEVILPGDVVFVKPQPVDDWRDDELINNEKRNVKVPYERLAQLTIRRSDGSKKIHRFRGRIHEAQKSLCSLMFGNRKCPITIRKFELHLSSGVLRFPLGIKIKVKELACHVHQIDSICKVIDTSSIPLDSLEIYKQRFDRRTAQLPCLQIARKLIVNGVRDVRPLASVKNQRVHVIFPDLLWREYVNLVRHWKNNPKSIGTCFTFGQIAGFPYPDITEMIEREYNGTRVGERLIEILVNDNSKIQVSYGSVEWGEENTFLKFEVVAA